MKKILLFITLYTLHTHLNIYSQWTQQILPVSGTLYDIAFFDANTGIISMYSSNFTPYVLRTTNSGNNWSIINNLTIFNLNIIDSHTIYGNGDNTSLQMIYRTFDKGLSWDSTAISSNNVYTDISFINHDTGWICGASNLGTIWKTTNGGVTLVQQLASGTSGMNKIFFLKERVNGEYTGWCSQGNFFRKTTNGGINWIQVNTITVSQQIYFINKDTGWICNGSLFKSTDGGTTFINQPMPTSPYIVFPGIYMISRINSNTIFGVGGIANYGGSQSRGIIWATTNGGINWGYQQPDTSIQAFRYDLIDFADISNGWAALTSIVHTTNGGGPIIYTDINNNNTNIPESFKLKQNYPNPFNPQTTIEFSLKSSAYVKLYIYDIKGEKVFDVIRDWLLETGNHQYRIDAFGRLGLPSGIYFYRIEVSDRVLNKALHMETKKMIFLK